MQGRTSQARPRPSLTDRTRSALPRSVQRLIALVSHHLSFPPDFSPEDIRVYREVSPYTMTSPERVKALVDAVHYVVRRRIPGAFVECGVWRGGSAIAAMIALSSAGDRDRDVYLFDTFEGMPGPASMDVDFRGRSAAASSNMSAASARTSAPIRRRRAPGW